jgi:ketosteroid isomerase-like protein
VTKNVILRRNLKASLVNMFVAACMLIAPVLMLGMSSSATPTAGPTQESALAAEQEIAQALLANDANAVKSLLDDDWAVVNTDGGLGDGVREAFCTAIESGQFIRKTMKLDLSTARVRLYGNIAVVTINLATSGVVGNKPFDVKERQTDVLKWKDGGWKSVLTHETKIKE